MNSKEHIRKLVEHIQNLTGKTQEAIAIDMGYGKNYISEILSPSGRPSKKFLNTLHSYVVKIEGYILENPKNETLEIPVMMREPGESYGKSNVDKYTKLLEDNDRFFKRILETNLASIGQTQQAILAHVQAMVQMDAERQSGGNPEKLNRVLQEWGRQIAGSLAAQTKTDTDYIVKNKVS